MSATDLEEERILRALASGVCRRQRAPRGAARTVTSDGRKLDHVGERLGELATLGRVAGRVDLDVGDDAGEGAGGEVDG